MSRTDHVNKGLLLFAHGARDAAWAAPFEAIAQAVRDAAPDHAVVLAYLELMQPTLDEAADGLVHAGCRDITVVPLFLGAGGHVRRDLPALVAALRQRFASVVFRVTPAIGESAVVTRAIAQAALRLVRETAASSSSS